MSEPSAQLPPDDLRAGTLFGRNAIVQRLAVGGMAVVYEAQHLDLQKRVAIKVMHAEFARDPHLVQRFILEARAASRLSHPHVIAVSDVGVEHGLPFLVMDYLQGEDLYAAMERERPLPLERLTDIMLPVISAVAAAHAEGILHRDLKPENVFLARGRSQREHPTLLDFGISTPMQRTQHASGQMPTDGGAIGTPAYMSPEQLEAATDLDGRSDQYALGVILYECATGVHPHSADTLVALVGAVLGGQPPPLPSERVPELPPEFDAVVMRAMSRRREARFESVRELGRALWPFASPLAQAIWAEEFGDPTDVAARMSARRPSSFAPRSAPTITSPPPSNPVSKPSPGPPVTITSRDLRAFDAFEQCSDAELDDLLKRTRARRYVAGTEIVTQGAHGHACFLLVSGEVQVVKTAAHGRWILGTLPAGAVFGQIALIENLARTASIVAATDTVVVKIGRAVFDDLSKSTSNVAIRLREHVAISGIRQLRLATRRLTAVLDRPPGGPSGGDPRKDLVYVQAAASEWGLPLASDDEPESE